MLAFKRLKLNILKILQKFLECLKINLLSKIKITLNI